MTPASSWGCHPAQPEEGWTWGPVEVLPPAMRRGEGVRGERGVGEGDRGRVVMSGGTFLCYGRCVLPFGEQELCIWCHGS